MDRFEQLDLAGTDTSPCVDIDTDAERRMGLAVRFLHGRCAHSLRDYTLRPKAFTNKLRRLHIRINTGFWNRHELSIVVFAAQGRPLSAQAPSRDGAVDADAGGEALARAAVAERRVLRAARDGGRVADRRSLAGDGNGLRQPRCARHLYRAANRGQIGRASCRERVKEAVVARRATK